MRRRAPGEIVEPYRRRVHASEGEGLRNRLAAWADSVVGGLMGTWPALPPGIKDRDADVWEPLLVVADAAGGRWPDMARVAAVTIVTLSRESIPSLGIRLLGDLRKVFADASVMSTEAILTALHDLEESPWTDIKGKPLNDRGLAVRLRQYDIRPKVVRIGERTLRGYAQEDLHDAWLRYLGPSPHESATSVTSATERQ